MIFRKTCSAIWTLGLVMLTGLLPWYAAGQGPLPTVTVVATGGTIAGQSETRTSFQSYEAGQLLISDMVASLQPDINKVADVDTMQFGNRGSGGYEIADYYDLTRAVERALTTADAVVVTSGTTTMDEIVYWLDLTVQSRKPVVITGAMRPWTVIGSDGPANLFNAIVLAASGDTRCFGSVLMMNDEFHAAKEVWKGNGMRLDTLVSREAISTNSRSTPTGPRRGSSIATLLNAGAPPSISLRSIKQTCLEPRCLLATRARAWLNRLRRGPRLELTESSWLGPAFQLRSAPPPKPKAWSSIAPSAFAPAATTSTRKRPGCCCC